MELLPKPAPGPGPGCLLPLSVLLLLIAPELGPNGAHAEETDWVRLPSKCEGEGGGAAGRILREGRGLRRRVWRVEGAGRLSPFIHCTYCGSLRVGLWDAGERAIRSLCTGAHISIKTSRLSRVVTRE